MLFTCPSRYSSTIGHTGVFRLGGWSPQLHARLLGSGVTQEHHWWTSPDRLLPGSHRLWRPVPGDFAWPRAHRPWVLQPRGHKDHGLGLGPFRSPLLGASQLISLPPGTEMFQFPGFAPSEDGDSGSPLPGFPIRPSRAQCVCATPPSLSQLTTAFIASVCPGIPHMPSVA